MWPASSENIWMGLTWSIVTQSPHSSTAFGSSLSDWRLAKSCESNFPPWRITNYHGWYWKLLQFLAVCQCNFLGIEQNGSYSIKRPIFFSVGKKSQITPPSPHCMELILLALWPQLIHKSSTISFLPPYFRKWFCRMVSPMHGASNIWE